MRGTARLWGFRVAAVLLGAAVPVVLELICRLFGWGTATVYEDPFVGFMGVKPLFELNADSGRYEVAKGKLKFFSPESFAARKTKGTFRVFCLGGSTMKGRPYSKETAFSSWLELGLQAAEPERSWEVVNCGGVSYASYRLVNLLKECLAYEPDLFVICTGHNEFLEDRTYEHLKRVPKAVAVSQGWASRLHLYRTVRGLLGEEPAVESERFEMTEEVQALLDYRGGLEVYDRNERWRRDVVRHFDHNLRAMVRLARDAGVPVMFVRPSSDLRSTPPFKSQHRDDLTLDERLEWQAAVNRARDSFEEDLEHSVKEFRTALAIDDRVAALHYEMGKCFELLGRRREAKRALERALEEDVCPLRMTADLVAAMVKVARAGDVPLVDAHALLERESRLQILGNDQLVDHVHPSIEGHKRIALAVLEVMGSEGFCELSDGWEARRDELFKAHFDSLDAAYFAAARRALHGLQQWAAGRATSIPVESQRSPRKE